MARLARDGFEYKALKGFVCISSGGHFDVGTLVPGQSWGALCAELKAILHYASMSFGN
jgi:hypothetical protein